MLLGKRNVGSKNLCKQTIFQYWVSDCQGTVYVHDPVSGYSDTEVYKFLTLLVSCGLGWQLAKSDIEETNAKSDFHNCINHHSINNNNNNTEKQTNKKKKHKL